MMIDDRWLMMMVVMTVICLPGLQCHEADKVKEMPDLSYPSIGTAPCTNGKEHEIGKCMCLYTSRYMTKEGIIKDSSIINEKILRHLGTPVHKL